MIRVQLLCGDDREFAVTGQVVQADKTFYIAFGEDPDSLQVLQLDLTAENADRCRLEVGTWYGYGHPPGEIDAPGGLHKNDGRHRRPPGQMGSQENTVHNRQMRAWADETGFTCAKGRNKGKPGYHELKSGGGFYHSMELKQAFAAHLKALAGMQDATPGAAA